MVNPSWSFTTSSFVDGFIKLISRQPKMDRYTIYNRNFGGEPSRKRLTGDARYPLRSMYVEGNDLAIEQILTAYFSAVHNHIWSKIENKIDNVLVTNIGLLALYDVLSTILQRNKINKEFLGSFDNKFSCINLKDYTDKTKFPASTRGKADIVASLLVLF